MPATSSPAPRSKSDSVREGTRETTRRGGEEKSNVRPRASRSMMVLLALQQLFRPGPQRLLDGVELLGEEMIGAGDDHALGVADAADQLLQFAGVAVLVVGS